MCSKGVPGFVCIRHARKWLPHRGMFPGNRSAPTQWGLQSSKKHNWSIRRREKEHSLGHASSALQRSIRKGWSEPLKQALNTFGISHFMVISALITFSCSVLIPIHPLRTCTHTLSPCVFKLFIIHTQCWRLPSISYCEITPKSLLLWKSHSSGKPSKYWNRVNTLLYMQTLQLKDFVENTKIIEQNEVASYKTNTHKPMLSFSSPTTNMYELFYSYIDTWLNTFSK